MSATTIRSMTALILLAGALLFGGGRLPMPDMLVELIGLALIAVLVVTPGRRPPMLDGRRAYVLLGACLLLPLLQIIPLPPALWQSLPGREAATAVGALAGQAGEWRPLSLDPEMTRNTALALLPAVAMFVATLDATPGERRMLALTVIAGALASAILGVAQVASGSQALYPYETAHFGLPVGLFANRNHQADLLLIAALLLVGVARRYREELPLRVAALGALAFLVLTLVVTRSRTAMLLTVLVLPIAALIAIDRKRHAWRPILIGFGLIAVAGIVLATNATIQAAFARFGVVGDDLRFDVWSDSAYAAAHYFPVGSGGGTFVPVFQTIERVQSMTVAVWNHAHDDYLELLLEYGLPAVILFAGYIALVARQLLRPTEKGERLPRALAALSILVLLLHSLTDYPLRNLSLLVVFAMLNAMLFPAAVESRRGRHGAVSKRRSAAS